MEQRSRNPVGLLLPLLTMGTFWLFQGSDTTYHLNSATGELHVPFGMAQAAGCVATLALLAVLAGWWLGRNTIILVVTVALIMAWSSGASPETVGIWAIGAVTVAAVGVSVTTAATRLGDLLRDLIRRRRGRNLV